MQLILASNNAHKIEELRRLFAETDVSFAGLSDWPELPEPPETQDTFAGNALQKARFVFERTGIMAVADDSGLVVDALNGQPGVYSKRWTLEATAQSNNHRLLTELDGITTRTARFVCAMAVVWSGGERVIEGTCEGSIATALRGAGGFGYDPLFLPDARPGRTMAELSGEDKNAISHRGRAFCHLPALLAEIAGA
ncbi:MAG: XTP/dITP diphosphohydrolase [Myxococcota bacterium]|jgi:XTP/dITP diphosphohydrolase